MADLLKISPQWMGTQLPVTEAIWADNDLVFIVRQADKTLLKWIQGDNQIVNIPLDCVIRGGLFYGGGELTAFQHHLYFTEKSGQLYEYRIEEGSLHQLTHHSGRCAAPTLSADGQQLMYIYSDSIHDHLRLLDLSQSAPDPWILRTQADFFMQPAFHPDGERIAWVEWNHPQMPWQGCRLMLARLCDHHLMDIRTLAGDESTPVFQPQFSPDGRWLSYIRAAGEGDNLMLFDLHNGSEDILYRDMSLTEPAWVQGLRTGVWLPDSSGLLQLSHSRGEYRLWHLELNGKPAMLDTAPYTSLKQISLSTDGRQWSLIASAADQTPVLITARGYEKTIRFSSFAVEPAPEVLPDSRPVQWESEEGTVFGIFYSPAPQRVGCQIPPVILQVHSGPTRQVDRGFSADTAFFTSRGFAVLAINYHGSTGYGHAYCDALNGRWGDLDVLDVYSGVRFLLDRQLADPQRLVIRGSSAGGFTVLHTLIRYPGLFKAGICAYPVSNLTTIVDETFKFEARYYDSLIGPYPQERQKYIDRSPVTYVNQISDPLAIFQGEEDEVVPFSQAEEIAQNLQQRGIPCHYHLFPGEGHGWQRKETLEAYYAETETFLNQYLS